MDAAKVKAVLAEYWTPARRIAVTVLPIAREQ
jgi:hypothetical protein